MLQQIDERLENVNGYLDQVAAQEASVWAELQKTNNLLAQMLEELRTSDKRVESSGRKNGPAAKQSRSR